MAFWKSENCSILKINKTPYILRMKMEESEGIVYKIYIPHERKFNWKQPIRNDFIIAKYFWNIDESSFQAFEKTEVSICFSLPDRKIDLQLKVYPNATAFEYFGFMKVRVLSVSEKVSDNPVKLRLGITRDGSEKPEKSVIGVTEGTSLQMYFPLEDQQKHRKRPLSKLNSTDELMTVFCELSAFCKHEKIQKMDFKLHSKYWEDMNILFETKKLADSLLFVKGQHLKAHKIILQTISPSFAEFAVPINTRIGIKMIPDMSYKAVNELLRYMYTGEVGNIDNKTAKELLLASVEYEVEGLRSICFEAIVEKINVQNWSVLFRFVLDNKIEDLKEKTLTFYGRNSTRIKKTDGFKALRRLELDDLFSSLTI